MERLNLTAMAQPKRVSDVLAENIDPAFLPRPIRSVEQLPRDTTSKLKQADLAQLIVAQPAND